jgi:lipoprotein-anchoring transpeptidase ErfK/SrfK
LNSTIFRKPTVLVLAATWILGGCLSRDPRYSGETVYLGGYKNRPKEEKRAPHDDVSYWDDSAGEGPASIRISLTDQKAYFYKGQDLVGVSALSSGREGFSSPTGSFKIQLKDRDHKSSLYGDYVDKEGTVLMRDIDVKKDPKPPGAIFDGAKMPFFMKITGGVGMHEGFLPGYPASHGCIRMPGFMAEKFFENVQVGTPVVIVP